MNDQGNGDKMRHRIMTIFMMISLFGGLVYIVPSIQNTILNHLGYPPAPSRIYQEGVKSEMKVENRYTDTDMITSKVIPYANASSLRGKVSNIYFLKLIRCGSTTLTNVFARFAWNHDLRVATKTRATWKMGEPKVSYFIESLVPAFTVGKSEKYNMFIDHSEFVPEAIEKILHGPTTLVSILRNPWRRYLFHLNVEVGDKAVKSFLYKLNTCKSCNLSLSEIKPDRYLWTRKTFDIPLKINATENLKKLDELFTVGITEYFDESMILIRRKLGWSLKDVIYYPVHVHNYTKTDLSDRLYNDFCTFWPDECELYEHFNKTFWKMVEYEGDNFPKEVMHYKTVLDKVFGFCTPVYSELDSGKPVNPSTKTRIEGSEWNEPFEISYMDCAQMRLTDKSFRPFFFYKQNRNYGCEEDCDLNDIPQDLCTQICKATKASHAMELYTNATLNPLSD